MTSITDEEVTCFHMVKHVMKFHKQLSPEDVKFASNYICSFYNYTKSLSKSPFDEEKLLLFLTYANQKGVCKFALTYNSSLDRAIKSRNKTELKNLLTGLSEYSFVELYDNPFLSEADKKAIERLLVREFFSTKLTLSLVKEKVFNADLIDDNCNEVSYEEERDESGNLVSLSKECYETVCIQDSKVLGCSQIDGCLIKHDRLPSKVYTVDGTEPQVYCFDTLELIDAVTNKTPSNPITGQPFTQYALKLIDRRFHKEIALYRRYKSTR